MRCAKRRRRTTRATRAPVATASVSFPARRASLGITGDDMVAAMGRAAPSLKALYKIG